MQEPTTQGAATMSTTETTTATTVKVTICGPNLPGDASGTFHVHKAGCADLTRSRMYRRIDPPWSMDATSERDVVEAVYSDIIDENPDYGWDSYHQDFKFFPCVEGLPLETAEPEQAPSMGCDEFDHPTPNPLTTATDRCPECGENFTGHCEGCALTDTGVEQVDLLIAGPSTPGRHFVDDEDARREAVAWLLGNISQRPTSPSGSPRPPASWRTDRWQPRPPKPRSRPCAASSGQPSSGQPPPGP
jgi:hypothetical protein